jgi:hypothetical protein
VESLFNESVSDRILYWRAGYLGTDIIRVGKDNMSWLGDLVCVTEATVRPASALSGFDLVLRAALGLPANDVPDNLANDTASNDNAAFGRLLAMRDVGTTDSPREKLPKSVVRQSVRGWTLRLVRVRSK